MVVPVRGYWPWTSHATKLQPHSWFGAHLEVAVTLTLMRVTQQELREITGADDVLLLHEVNLAARYVDDVGFIAQLHRLQVRGVLLFCTAL